MQHTRFLMACASNNQALIEQALADLRGPWTSERLERVADFDERLVATPWSVAFCDLKSSDFSALDMASRLSDEGIERAMVVIQDTGAEEIALNCLCYGMCHFIRLEPAYLERLPMLVESLLNRLMRDQTRTHNTACLEENEARYKDIFDNTSDLIQCLAPDGRFLYTNRTWRETMGYSEEEVKSLNLLDVLHPDSLVCCQDRFQRLMNGEALTCITFKFRTKSGESVHLLGDCGSIIKDGGAISTRGIFKNVTETVKVRDALRVTEARYQALYENAPDLYLTLNVPGEILSVNQNGASLLGYEASELVGESVAKIIHPEDQERAFSGFDAHFQGEMEQDVEYRLMKKDGTLLWVHQRTSREEGESSPRLLVLCRDISEKHELQAQLAHQATHDALTNLINRREFERRLQRILAASWDHTDQHSLCFLDLDQFKRVNDTCGHLAGDELLRQIAALLESQVRSRDTLARLGGDEFVILMEHTPIEKAHPLGEKLRATLENFVFHWRSQKFSVGVSIGIVSLLPGETIVDTLNRADMACYRAKQAGRNQVCLDAGKSPDVPARPIQVRSVS